MSSHARRHRASRGQSLVIFALVSVVLLGVVGLAVDGGFSYFASDRMERAAMSAALAGVPDMPDFATSPNDATSTAISAATLNGFASGGATNVTITVAKVPDPNNAGVFLNNQLSVTVAADVPVFFMKLLGFGSHRESRTAVAEYLRPITFGQPGSQLGSDLASLGTGSNYYFMRSEGWGTDRGQGDAYGPNPASTWSTSGSTPNIDVHALSGTAGTETASQPPLTMPQRGGQNYQIYVPAGQTARVQVYNPVFAPDNASTGGNAAGYNYHEDDGDFTETTVAGAPNGKTCQQGANVSPSYCVGPPSIQQWPIMSYTVYKSANPFDHSGDVWVSNVRIRSIDGSAGTGKYTIPGIAGAPQTLATLTAYHAWVDVQATPVGAQAAALDKFGATTGPVFNGSATAGLTGGANGTTYRLRVDQLDSNSSDPATGNAQNVSSQAHKGYGVEATGCGNTSTTSCTVTALDDITLFTPIQSGTFSMPLMSIPPEYAGHNFSLYIYDPGDVSGNSNVLAVTQPVTAGTGQATADTTDGVYSGDHGEGTAATPATWTQQVAPGTGAASIQTIGGGGSHLYNGLWIRFDISVPADYGTTDVDPNNSATWFWHLSYTTASPAGDTITANLGFVGAPVHIVKG